MAREGQASVRLADGRVLLIGGQNPWTGMCVMACVPPATASVDVYDPRTGRVTHNGSLIYERADPQAVLLNDGRVFVSGAWFGGPSSPMEIYDPARGTSSEVKPPAELGQLPLEAAMTLLADGRVFIAGGGYDEGFTSSNKTLIFDPATGGFSFGPLLSERRQEATATLLQDGRVLIVGGVDSENGNGLANDDAELIDPSNPLSKPVLVATGLAAFVPPATSTLLSDGRVLVTGGGSYDEATGVISPTLPLVFDPRTGEFSATHSMITPRTGSTAVLVPDGRVLIFGGVDARGLAVDTIEAFDPGSGTFQTVATGFPEISDFSATLLDGGGVLIAGGTTADWNGLTSRTWFVKP